MDNLDLVCCGLTFTGLLVSLLMLATMNHKLPETDDLGEVPYDPS